MSQERIGAGDGTVALEELIEAFSATVGYERAESVVTESADAAGVDDDRECAPGEAEAICAHAEAAYDDPIGAVARTLRNRIRLRHLGGEEADDVRTLFSRTTDAVVEVEFRDDDPVVRRTNPAFDDLFEVGPEAVGRSVTGLGVPPASDDRWAALVDRLRDGDDIDLELTEGDRDFRLRGVGLLRDGAVDRAYLAYTDISERKARERELRRQNEHLEAFASVVSHDLRNPLTVARGHLELAREEADVPYAEDIAAAHDRIERIIEEMLALARHGQTIAEPTPVAVHDTAREAWANVATGEADLEPAGVDRAVYSDRERLLHVFENLFRNSVEHAAGEETRSDADAGDDGGRSDRGEGLTVRVGVEDGVLYVADDGPGIPPDRRDEVFEAGTTDAEDGTGLGLFIVKQIAEAHGWSVELTDSAEGGARFEFEGVEVVE
ncbi:sensor histidine kinase [Natronomonas marina]|jgi:signal transduction histidine kinase|uniref:sensor histidine kinase n=1 Tax=Natronomonas marina TaxID=2961939 RepID=UPI0020C99B5C|nr:HAMP domain-containing sensor histidine kinase [Natronomonas marina]